MYSSAQKYLHLSVDSLFLLMELLFRLQYVREVASSDIVFLSDKQSEDLQFIHFIKTNNILGQQGPTSFMASQSQMGK